MSQDATTNCEPKLLNVTEVAEILQCSERHVYRLEAKGLMPEAVRPGSIVRWQQERISAWIHAGCPPTVAV
jgi:excisionase family DNA binding protein